MFLIYYHKIMQMLNGIPGLKDEARLILASEDIS